ncbi:phosphate acyltransferase PlsX [Kushneria phosphatilytica]|uniref:Phosphate acyltransferase n=1 Tax=Kushneria phosphatilytica TaxID=657387 RepID=A0A5C0ZZ25_9GAMM|nr:phosphate acyltransferase PlsX [Kushneria phosphatilytica]QEL10967.1 phosphate acyltransferase PlsX [Kushneria phosphatilytica]
MRLAIDAMGGDFGPRATVGGSVEALQALPDLQVLLCGAREQLEDQLESISRVQAGVIDRITIIDAPVCLPDTLSPARALRLPAASSLHATLQAVAEGRADGCVSAGATGVLMAMARRQLGMIPGLSRPAISTAIPARGCGRCYLLDLGANIDSRPRHLLQFARMGAEMARAVDGVTRPRVALLNVATEPNRGERRVREADELLRQETNDHFDYHGFVEGDGLFSGVIDVAVCDGMVGNVALKSGEALIELLVERLSACFQHSWASRMVSVLARPALSRFRREFDPVRYNGASLLGLKKTVVKSHGSASMDGFGWAVRRAHCEVVGELTGKLAAALAADRHA